MRITKNYMCISESTPTGTKWEIAPNGSETSMLKLNGDLKPGWLGRLSSYLSVEKINIVKGTASKCSSLSWDANFEIEKDSRPIECDLDFNPLTAFSAEFTHGTAVPALKVSNILIKRSSRHGGSVYVEISAKDCLGFLHSILSIFSFYSLFPTELEVNTKANTVFDQFWLKGIGFSNPSDEDMESLKERLTRTMY
jgi:hypothetical protein